MTHEQTTELAALVEEFKRETVPTLVKKWPEKFNDHIILWSDADGNITPIIIDPCSLDCLAAIAEVVGGVTWATFETDDEDGHPYWLGGAFCSNGHVFDRESHSEGSMWHYDRTEYSSEIAARLAATITLVAALGGAS